MVDVLVQGHLVQLLLAEAFLFFFAGLLLALLAEDNGIDDLLHLLLCNSRLAGLCLLKSELEFIDGFDDVRVGFPEVLSRGLLSFACPFPGVKVNFERGFHFDVDSLTGTLEPDEKGGVPIFLFDSNVE